MSGERRGYHRLVVNAFVRLYDESSILKSCYYQGVLKNYSRSGLFISTKQLLPKGCIVTMEIPVEDDKKQISIVQVRGVVRRIDENAEQEGIGVEFFELKDSENESFQDWLSHLLVD